MDPKTVLMKILHYGKTRLRSYSVIVSKIVKLSFSSKASNKDGNSMISRTPTFLPHWSIYRAFHTMYLDVYSFKNPFKAKL